MAATAITTTKILKYNTYYTVGAAAACDATLGALVTLSSADHKTLIIITNADDTNAETVTIKKAGDGQADLAVSVPKSGVRAVVVESALFADDGVITITGTADVTVQAIQLP